MQFLSVNGFLSTLRPYTCFSGETPLPPEQVQIYYCSSQPLLIAATLTSTFLSFTLFVFYCQNLAKKELPSRSLLKVDSLILASLCIFNLAALTYRLFNLRQMRLNLALIELASNLQTLTVFLVCYLYVTKASKLCQSLQRIQTPLQLLGVIWIISSITLTVYRLVTNTEIRNLCGNLAFILFRVQTLFFTIVFCYAGFKI